MRETSKLAYKYIMGSGIFAVKQKHAYEYMYHNGPLTAKELTVWSMRDGAWKCFAPLKARGVFIEVGRKKCEISGRDVLLWDVTNKMPIDAPPRVTNEQKIKELRMRVDNLEEENLRLLTENDKLKRKEWGF